MLRSKLHVRLAWTGINIVFYNEVSRVLITTVRICILLILQRLEPDKNFQFWASSVLLSLTLQ